jgi:hypothetical protein
VVDWDNIKVKWAKTKTETKTSRISRKTSLRMPLIKKTKLRKRF